MRDWALELLQCPTCGASPLDRDPDAVRCSGCGVRYGVSDGIASFLREPNPVVSRELAAVSQLDGSADVASEQRLASRLRLLESGGLGPADLAEYPCLRHARESRSQIEEVLRSYPLEPGVLVELGADHCWASGLFLDAGCRVIAVDISDHLRLAPRAADAALCRIQADMNRLPLRPASVQTVWATAAAHHSWDLATTFREAARVLRPGGRLLFCCEPMPSWLRYPFGTDFGHEQKALGINETWIPRSRWLRLCERAGFEAHLAFPSMSDASIVERLRTRGLPRVLAPVVAPFLRTLQVSIHLVATRSAAT